MQPIKLYFHGVCSALLQSLKMNRNSLFSVEKYNEDEINNNDCPNYSVTCFCEYEYEYLKNKKIEFYLERDRSSNVYYGSFSEPNIESYMRLAIPNNSTVTDIISYLARASDNYPGYRIGDVINHVNDMVDAGFRMTSNNLKYVSELFEYDHVTVTNALAEVPGDNLRFVLERVKSFGDKEKEVIELSKLLKEEKAKNKELLNKTCAEEDRAINLERDNEKLKEENEKLRKENEKLLKENKAYELKATMLKNMLNFLNEI